MSKNEDIDINQLPDPSKMVRPPTLKQRLKAKDEASGEYLSELEKIKAEEASRPEEKKELEKKSTQGRPPDTPEQRVKKSIKELDKFSKVNEDGSREWLVDKLVDGINLAIPTKEEMADPYCSKKANLAGGAALIDKLIKVKGWAEPDSVNHHLLGKDGETPSITIQQVMHSVEGVSTDDIKAIKAVLLNGRDQPRREPKTISGEWTEQSSSEE